MKQDDKHIIKVGFIDSGVGCILFAKRLYETASLLQPIPQLQLIHILDQKNIPYGTKPKEEIITLGKELLKRGLKQCDNMFIACNTLSTIHKEIKPKDAQSKKIFPIIEKTVTEICKQSELIEKETVNIVILATEATILSGEYQEEVKRISPLYTKKTININMQSMNDWVFAAEHYYENKNVNFDLMAEHDMGQLIKNNAFFKQADIIALCCTHYIIFSSAIIKAFSEKGINIKLIYQPDIFVQDFLSIVQSWEVQPKFKTLSLKYLTSTQEKRYLSRFIENLYQDTPNLEWTIETED